MQLASAMDVQMDTTCMGNVGLAYVGGYNQCRVGGYMCMTIFREDTNPVSRGIKNGLQFQNTCKGRERTGFIVFVEEMKTCISAEAKSYAFYVLFQCLQYLLRRLDHSV